MTIVLFVVGLALLVVGAEALVRGASRLAVAAGISPLVVGLTVVAFGTSAPELAVTLGAALAGEPEMALGNVVGSNIANVLLILGLSAAVAPLVVAQQLVRFDVPLMIGVSFLVLLLARDGSIGRAEGGLLFGGVITYVVVSVLQSRREEAAIRAEYAGAFTPPARRGRLGWLVDLGLLVGGLAMLVLGARWLVAGAVAAAAALGVSELVIGLTVVAIGTSLPEVATSVIASVRGERDIAVGNVVGSNLYNLLAVLGAGALASAGGVPVPAAALAFDLPVMVVAAVACLPVFFTGYCIARWEGWLFLGYYGAYLAYVVLAATEHAALPAFGAAMSWFVLPLTALTLAVLAVGALRRSRAGGQG
jgi:cation:H+ antiporter